MSTQHKLNALLFELQTARSPLAQAKILARAWRTVRELSPTDRKLLARHAGFDGAEEILEGLARKKSGVAPAMLLQVLSNARGTDASTLRNIMSAFRDPSRRDEAVSQSLDLVADLMRDEESAAEVGETLDGEETLEPAVEETPDEALEALRAAEGQEEGDLDKTGKSTPLETEPRFEIEPDTPPEPPPALSVPAVVPESEPIPGKPEPIKPLAVDWSRWDSTDERLHPASTPRPEIRPAFSTPGAPRIGRVAAAATVGVESSVLARLRALQRALPELAGSKVAALTELIEAFPDGWARRRALSALIEAGIPENAEDTVTLVASVLGRELDRRWCLRVLAARGDLRGASLDRANELLSSPSARRRLSALVSQPRSES
jgi:hypothetical protein